MSSETELGGKRREFLPTAWSVVLRAKDKNFSRCREALDELIARVWKPVYFFIRRKGYDVESAKDLTQQFFAVFIEKNFLQSVEQGKGRFRSFLLAALEHFLSKHYEHMRAQKRGGGRHFRSLDLDRAEDELSHVRSRRETPDKMFRREWCLSVLKGALTKLKGEWISNGERKTFSVLKDHLSGGEGASYRTIARRLGVKESDVTNLLHRARTRYRELILEEVRPYVASEKDLREEVWDLFEALS